MSPPPNCCEEDWDDPTFDEYSDDEGGESEESEDASEHREVSPPIIRHSWPDLFDAGTEPSSPSASSRGFVSRRRRAVAKRVDGFTDESRTSETAVLDSLQDTHMSKSKAVVSCDPPASASPFGSAGHSASSNARSGGTDRAALALKQAAAAEAAASTELFPQGLESAATFALDGASLIASSSSSSSSALPVRTAGHEPRSRPNEDSSGAPAVPTQQPDAHEHRPWRRDASSSRSADERRGRKRRGHWELPPPKKERHKPLHHEPVQVPDFQSMSGTEMNDYIQWWRKMHSMTLRGRQQHGATETEPDGSQLPLFPLSSDPAPPLSLGMALAQSSSGA